MRAYVARLAIVVTAVGSSVCASLFYKAPNLRGEAVQIVEVTSEPSGATVRLNGVVAGVTPAKVVVRRREAGQVLSIEKDGYATADVPLKRGVDPATFTNLVWTVPLWHPLAGLEDGGSAARRVSFGVILPVAGFAIDAATGAAFAVQPRVHVTLAPKADVRWPRSSRSRPARDEARRVN